MKLIAKDVNEPSVFIQWRKEGGWNASDPKNNPKAFKLKQEIKVLLLKEQGFICCYCEERITEDNMSSHIEHLLPKGNPSFAHLTSSYSNLLCSCNSESSCGKTKKNSTIKITPLIQNCENFFTYSYNGEIEGINHDASETIDILNLKSERLKWTRFKMIETFLNMEELTSMTSLSEYDNWVQFFLEKYDKEFFIPFWSMMKWLADDYRCCFESKSS